MIDYRLLLSVNQFMEIATAPNIANPSNPFNTRSVTMASFKMKRGGDSEKGRGGVDEALGKS